jgi:hypothetical protein
MIPMKGMRSWLVNSGGRVDQDMLQRKREGRKKTSSVPDLASEAELVSQINIIYTMSVDIHKIRMPIG